jgi:hypothetical protein
MPTAMGFSFPLDRTSRLRLRIFGFKLLIAVPVSVAVASHHNYPLLGALRWMRNSNFIDAHPTQ